MYPEVLVAPMRQELTRLGVEELRTPEQVDARLSAAGTTLVVVNSVCGCAARNARPAVARALAAGLDAVQRFGQAEPGDKTLVDTLVPFGAALDEAVAGGAGLAEAWATALPAAEEGMRATTGMVSKRGRASRLGERSRGVQDAGATSIFYVLRAFGEAIADKG